ncbi:MAG: hypothetical protein KAR79_00030, partial [Simkaniaceae bacterium]|nr:hypothetical protein [Simkaniaceae bacterium]
MSSVFFSKKSILLTLFLIAALLSTLLAKDTHYLIPYYSWHKLFLSSLIAFFIIHENFYFQSKDVLKQILQCLVIAALFQSLVAISQYFLQHSLGIGFLGEPHLNLKKDYSSNFLMSDGSLFLFDHLFEKLKAPTALLRAHGTFNDPNILGGYLAFCIIATSYLFLRSKTKWTERWLSLA